MGDRDRFTPLQAMPISEAARLDICKLKRNHLNIVSVPNTANIQRIGRTKTGPDFAVQYMLLGKDRLPMTLGKTSTNTSSALRTGSVISSARYSPFGVETRFKSETLRLFFAAKLSAARVGLPSRSKATLTGGPTICSTRPDCSRKRAGAKAMRRRGVEAVLTAGASGR